MFLASHEPGEFSVKHVRVFAASFQQFAGETSRDGLVPRVGGMGLGFDRGFAAYLIFGKIGSGDVRAEARTLHAEARGFCGVETPRSLRGGGGIPPFARKAKDGATILCGDCKGLIAASPRT
jgi:hypothetical protein